jgi:hypothetical protein
VLNLIEGMRPPAGLAPRNTRLPIRRHAGLDPASTFSLQDQ